MHADTRAEPLRVRIRQALNIEKLPAISGIRICGACGAAARCACLEMVCVL